jgi:predicted N-acetyltransferase YhbS
MPALIIRELEPRDSVEAITALLHRAYARNAAAGLAFGATHQAPEVTRQRLSQGWALVAERDRAIVGTIVLYCPQKVPYGEYEPGWPLASFGQFAVDPELPGEGLGRKLLGRVEAEARARGAQELCLDTAQPARGLIAYYERLGYRIVARADWRPEVNYESWIMAKPLREGGAADP